MVVSVDCYFDSDCDCGLNSHPRDTRVFGFSLKCVIHDMTLTYCHGPFCCDNEKG